MVRINTLMNAFHFDLEEVDPISLKRPLAFQKLFEFLI